MKPISLFQRLQYWCIEPSPKITEPDRRRQAALLSAFLLGIMVVGAIVEALTVALIEDKDYVGYRSTIAAISF